MPALKLRPRIAAHLETESYSMYYTIVNPHGHDQVISQNPPIDRQYITFYPRSTFIHVGLYKTLPCVVQVLRLHRSVPAIVSVIHMSAVLQSAFKSPLSPK